MGLKHPLRFEPLVLENAVVKLTIRPDLGGRIDQLYDRRTQINWLWHPPEYDETQSRSLPVGASFDEHWTGGWDEMFPNDAAGSFQGWELVDHGELWSQSWNVVEVGQFHTKLAYQCQTVPVAIEKTIQLSKTEPEVEIGYQFQNQSDNQIPFLFKQHCAIAIAAGDEILLPDCDIEPAFLEFSKIIGQPGKTRFPAAIAADGSEVDLRFIPTKSSQLQEFYYSSNLDIGACGIRRSNSALIMHFDAADFPYVWVFQSYGGWRDFYVLVLEPCTTVPSDLEIARQNGTLTCLQPHEVQNRKLTIRLK